MYFGIIYTCNMYINHAQKEEQSREIIKIMFLYLLELRYKSKVNSDGV